MLLALLLAQSALATLPQNAITQDDGPVWGWQCVQGRCERVPARDHAGRALPVRALSVCKLLCDPAANLWPRPQHVRVDRHVLPVNYNSITVELRGQDGDDDKKKKGRHQGRLYSAGELLQRAADLFRERQLAKASGEEGSELKDIGQSLDVTVVLQNASLSRLTLETDEGYELLAAPTEDGKINVTITADNFFGARHGLETLGQLLAVDDLGDSLVMPREVEVRDRPAYPYRGVLLDTSRNFVSLAVLRGTLDAMAASKLNTFHWHITDSHSFPFVSETYPKFHRYGAYTPRQVYSPADIRALVEYGLARGVRVLPELDAPAHVGEGWQWLSHNTTVCVKAEPWQKYCVEPPCGQLNPIADQVYDVIGGLYKDMISAFDKPDLFHMGGDEVNFNCWNSTEDIVKWMAARGVARDADGFRKVWDHFQRRAYQKLVDANGGEELPVIIWTSGLTSPGKVDLYLDPKKYIIQIWTKGDDTLIEELARKKYRLIFSNYEALYFDCGFGAWVGEGNNWCSPYIGWQKVYENDPKALLRALGADPEDALVLGAEATLWTEQADSQSVDGRLWPRAAALAERLWTDPSSGWREAEYRMIAHRERIVDLGVKADSLQPQWCLQNEGYCYLDKEVQVEAEH